MSEAQRQKLDFSYGVGQEFAEEQKREAARKIASLLDVKDIFRGRINMITEDQINERIDFYSKILKGTFQEKAQNDE